MKHGAQHYGLTASKDCGKIDGGKYKENNTFLLIKSNGDSEMIKGPDEDGDLLKKEFKRKFRG